jgi:ribonuclease-3
MDLSPLEKKLGIEFNSKDFLNQALVHRSYINENPDFGLEDNERLEFLGDAVLEMIVTEHLYRNYPSPEGDLTNWRAALVNAKMLSSIAEQLGVNDFLFLSKGENKDTGRARRYILANAMEAIIGAAYLDQGYEKISQFVEREILKKLPNIIKHKIYRDPKSRFQEEAQEKVGVTPTYEVVKEWGPDHNKNFVIGIYLGEEEIAQGQGASKQEAQEKAAEAALKRKGWE